MTIADWLKDKWTTADEAVRKALLLLADKLGIDIPLTRNSKVGVPIGPPIRRTKFDQHTSQGESADPVEADLAGMGMDPQFRRGPPEWHDELSDGWTSSESVHDALHYALHPDRDRGWY